MPSVVGTITKGAVFDSIVDAGDSGTDTTNFDSNLSAADDTVQKALETLDEVAAGALPAADTQTIIKGSADPTKLVRFEVDGLTTSTTRVLTVQDKDHTLSAQDELLTVFNVKNSDYGALGDDSTDDLAAIHLARDAAGTGNTIFFPKGTYRVSAVVTCNVQDQRWLFEEGAILKPTDAGHTDVAILRADATTGVVFENVTIDGNSANTGAATGIIIGTGSKVLNCTIDDVGAYGIIGSNSNNISIIGNRTSNTVNYGIWCQNVGVSANLTDVTIRDNHVDQTHQNPATSTNLGILVRGTATYPYTALDMRGNTILQCVDPTNSSAMATEIRYANGFTYNDNYAKDGAMGVSIAYCQNGTVNDNVCDGATNYAVEIAGESGAILENITCNGNTSDGQGIMDYAIAVHGTAAANANIVIANNSIKGCVDHGIYVDPDIDYVSITGNFIDCDIASTTNGIWINTGTNMVINSNTIRGQSNLTRGIRLGDGSSTAVINGNQIDDCTIGILLETTGTMDFVTVSGNVIENTTTPVSFTGGGTFGSDVRVIGNVGTTRNSVRADILDAGNDIIEAWGSSTPEGAVTAGIGSIFHRDDGGSSSTLYVKESGTGNTGWKDMGNITTGTTVPTSPVEKDMHLHIPTGRKVLLQYIGSSWEAIRSYGTTTLYVDVTDGADTINQGGAVDGDAYATWLYARQSLASQLGGNVVINLNAETHVNDMVFQGNALAGNYTIKTLGTMSELLGETTVTSATVGNGTVRATLTVSGAGWSVDAYKNKIIKFESDTTTTAAQSRKWLIYSNTSDTITMVGLFDDNDTNTALTIVSGDTFKILDWATTIQNSTTTGHVVDIKVGQQGIEIEDVKWGMKASTEILFIPANVNTNCYLTIHACEMDVPVFFHARVAGRLDITEVYASGEWVTGNLHRGFNAIQSGVIFINHLNFYGYDTTLDEQRWGVFAQTGSNVLIAAGNFENCAIGLSAAGSQINPELTRTVNGGTYVINNNVGCQASGGAGGGGIDPVNIVFSGNTTDKIFDAEDFSIITGETMHNWGGVDFENINGLSIEESLFIEERAAAIADIAGKGQWWVKDDTPCSPMFTRDDGTDVNLATIGGGDLLADGTVPLTADWNVGAFDLTMAALTIDTNQGAIIGDGTDADQTLITVDRATSDPTFIWDESFSGFSTVNARLNVKFDQNDTTISKVENLTDGTSAVAYFLAEAAGISGFGLACADNYTDIAGWGGNYVVTSNGGDMIVGPFSANDTIFINGGTLNEVGRFNSTEIRFELPVKIAETAAAVADTAAYGQYWAKNDTPNIPMYTDDAGTDIPLNGSGIRIIAEGVENIAATSNWVIPEGMYNLLQLADSAQYIEIQIASTWRRQYARIQGNVGIFSDGTNMRVANTSGSARDVYWQRLEFG